jgi:hypothetical protein
MVPTMERITRARRRVYALMGAGMHGLNGLNPSVSQKLWCIYIACQLYYGLEATGATEKQLQKMEEYQLQVMRQIQHLPTKTPSAAVYLLLGALPAEGEYHRRLLGFICNILRLKDSTEAKLIRRQAAIKDLETHSLISDVRKTLAKYHLPTIYQLIKHPPPQNAWKNQVKKATQDFWTEHLVHQAKKCTSLKYLNLDACRVGSLHQIWRTICMY